ncbi:MAG: hypothetical protein P4M02_04815 [Clostridia bacterium]|nr:hypothetical protein [Clostridia bacterium]
MQNSPGRTQIRLSEVNRAAAHEPQSFFERCNDGYEHRINDVCARIIKDTDASRIIMLSGPSSSAKTTTSLKLQRRLSEVGIHANTISLDDFFKNRCDLPLLADGSRDYESPSALDIPLLTQTISDLIFKGRAQLPAFDFKRGERSQKTRSIELNDDNIAIVEGLHALDTTVTQGIPAGRCLKLYVSVSSDFIDDDGRTVLSARSVRLIRRTIRDFKYRSSSPENTLDMWEAVCRGEDLYVRPFKRYADICLNSIFACEPCLFHAAALRLFSGVPQQSKHYDHAQKLLKAASAFEPMPAAMMPGTCVLREFTGGSVYYQS